MCHRAKKYIISHPTFLPYPITSGKSMISCDGFLCYHEGDRRAETSFHIGQDRASICDSDRRYYAEYILNKNQEKKGEKSGKIDTK